jgi:hypothetical protein
VEVDAVEGVDRGAALAVGFADGLEFDHATKYFLQGKRLSIVKNARRFIFFGDCLVHMHDQPLRRLQTALGFDDFRPLQGAGLPSTNLCSVLRIASESKTFRPCLIRMN